MRGHARRSRNRTKTIEILDFGNDRKEKARGS